MPFHCRLEQMTSFSFQGRGKTNVFYRSNSPILWAGSKVLNLSDDYDSHVFIAFLVIVSTLFIKYILGKKWFIFMKVMCHKIMLDQM